MLKRALLGLLIGIVFLSSSGLLGFFELLFLKNSNSGLFFMEAASAQESECGVLSGSIGGKLNALMGEGSTNNPLYISPDSPIGQAQKMLIDKRYAELGVQYQVIKAEHESIKGQIQDFKNQCTSGLHTVMINPSEHRNKRVVEVLNELNLGLRKAEQEDPLIKDQISNWDQIIEPTELPDVQPFSDSLVDSFLGNCGEPGDVPPMLFVFLQPICGLINLIVKQITDIISNLFSELDKQVGLNMNFDINQDTFAIKDMSLLYGETTHYN